MTRTQHTPGPWVLFGGTVYSNLNRSFVADCFPKFRGSNDEDEANARRIVSCVNALEGLNPEAVRELVEAATNALPGLEHAASSELRADVATGKTGKYPTIHRDRFTALRSALDKVRKER